MIEKLLIISLVVLMAGYIWYVYIMRKRSEVAEALAAIDIHLRQRFDLIPNILRIAAKYMEHEQMLMASITALRTQALAKYDHADAASLQEHFKTVEMLSSQMGKFVMNTEQYPDLKSNEAVKDAMHAYIEAEAQITAARRFYNSAVKEYNNAVEIFPGNIIAGLLNRRPMPVFEIAETARLPIQFMPSGSMENVAIAADPAAQIESPHHAKIR